MDEDEWSCWEAARDQAGVPDLLGMHHLYLATDVLALADIIEGFRRSFQGIYGIDLLHNLTLPKASWVGMLKSTKVHIELVTDQELYDDIEAGIRGDVCVPYQSHAVANDPRVQETTEPHSFIGYWDASSLYPWAMMQRLPSVSNATTWTPSNRLACGTTTRMRL